MASGDRIELLTANTFETAMSSVAKETSVAGVKSVADTINTNVNANKTTLSTINTNVNTIKTSVGAASTAPSTTSAGSVVNTANSVQQKLQGISQYQIGATNSTGGSATAGNVMAKLNAIIGNTTSSNKSPIQAVTPNKINMGSGLTYSGTQTLLNVTGSGTLYTIIVFQSSNVIIKVDGNIIYNASYDGSAATEMGITTVDFVSYGEDMACLFPHAYIHTSFSYTFKNGIITPTTSSSNAYNQICMVPLPIKFSSSLVVTASHNTKSSNTNTSYGYCYILD